MPGNNQLILKLLSERRITVEESLILLNSNSDSHQNLIDRLKLYLSGLFSEHRKHISNFEQVQSQILIKDNSVDFINPFN